ncbi:nucleotide exchange factor GrpE [archaeon]|jgi:molecular chaperone GrpE|nr:nucleotide exchange factor GrpE [archaeon]MBT4647914.1 nucleotide exchange factor GrpE [archaeon]MBT7393148.1 nucleotide exchange factor GrpE [archaeon]
MKKKHKHEKREENIESPKDKENESVELDKKEQKENHKKEEKKEKLSDVEILKNKIQELTDKQFRLQADFENSQRRLEKEKVVFLKFAKEGLIVSLLPVLDSFDSALTNTDNIEEFKKGVNMIHELFLKTLKSNGLSEIETEGKQFDPHLHEVMMKEKSDKKPDTIIQEFQKGYVLNEKIIRHSKVKVASDDN